MLRSLLLVVTMPNVAEVGFVSTVVLRSVPPQFGWFGKLNASARNWSACRSATRNVLNAARFQFWKPTWLKPTEFRFWFGRLPFAGRVAHGCPPGLGLK